MRPLELTTRVFGRLTVTSRSPQRYRRGYLWVCQCACGNTTLVLGASLISGNTTSCGCRGASVLGDNTRTHGLRRTPEYQVWANMRQRCTNPNNTQYADWGGRGITICPAWRDFAIFYRDMGPRPSRKHTIERIDNDGPYRPDNCRWATRKEQSRNQRHNRLLTYHGRTQLLTDWADELGIKMPTLCRRLDVLGWSVEETLSRPIMSNKGHS